MSWWNRSFKRPCLSRVHLEDSWTTWRMRHPRLTAEDHSSRSLTALWPKKFCLSLRVFLETYSRRLCPLVVWCVGAIVKSSVYSMFPCLSESCTFLLGHLSDVFVPLSTVQVGLPSIFRDTISSPVPAPISLLVFELAQVMKCRLPGMKTRLVCSIPGVVGRSYCTESCNLAVIMWFFENSCLLRCFSTRSACFKSLVT